MKLLNKPKGAISKHSFHFLSASLGLLRFLGQLLNSHLVHCIALLDEPVQFFLLWNRNKIISKLLTTIVIHIYFRFLAPNFLKLMTTAVLWQTWFPPCNISVSRWIIREKIAWEVEVAPRYTMLTPQTSYVDVECRWHQNWANTNPRNFFPSVNEKCLKSDGKIFRG